MVDAIGYGRYGVYNTPDTTEVKNPQNKQDETATTTKVNFEGRRDYDSFEKKGSHTARNVAIGTGIAAIALYAAAAFAGRGKGFKFKGENWFAKAGNTCIEKAYQSAKWLKDNTWGRIVGMFSKDKPKAE